MQEDVRNDLKSQLALMIARGKTINAWASQNEVPLRTAYRWSRDPQVRGEVQQWRRYLLDLTIGRLARLSLKATDGIAKLGAGASPSRFSSGRGGRCCPTRGPSPSSRTWRT